MKSNVKVLLSGCVALTMLGAACQSGKSTSAQAEQGERREKTAFQTGQPWKPTTDVRSDVAIVYGVGGNPSEKRANMTFEERVQSWRDKGYTTHFMTGIAWGEYQDYFTGQWEIGRAHV